MCPCTPHILPHSSFSAPSAGVVVTAAITVSFAGARAAPIAFVVVAALAVSAALAVHVLVASRGGESGCLPSQPFWWLVWRWLYFSWQLLVWEQERERHVVLIFSLLVLYKGLVVFHIDIQALQVPMFSL